LSAPVAEREDVSRRYRFALSPEDQSAHPCYAALCRAFSSDSLLIDLLLSVPLAQRNAMLVLAALHFQALSGHRELAPLYAQLGTQLSLAPDDFARRVVDIVHREPTVVSSLLTRHTQTNEPGRSAVFQAVLRELYRRGIDEVNLIDVGTSAGLNLYVDHYTIVREPAPPTHSALRFSYESLDAADLDGPLPAVRSRIGVDLHPLDLRSAPDAQWLRACLWPEDPVRLNRLMALEQIVPTWPPLTFIQAGALEGVERALEMVDPDAANVIMHSWAAAYFEPDLQTNFAARMRELVSTHRASWVYLEWPRAVAGLSPPTPETPAPRTGASQIVVAMAGGQPEGWGWCHPHGRWVSFSPASGPNA
jgi:hypothetical protein